MVVRFIGGGNLSIQRKPTKEDWIRQISLYIKYQSILLFAY